MAEKKDDRSPQQKAAATRTRNKRKANREAVEAAKDKTPPIPGGPPADANDPNAPSHERDKLVGQKTPNVVYDTGQNPQPRVNPGRPEIDNPDNLPEYHPDVQDARDEAVSRGPYAGTQDPEDADVFWDDSIHIDPVPVMAHHAPAIMKDRARYDHGRPDLADAPGEHGDDDAPRETPALSDPKFSPFKKKGMR